MCSSSILCEHVLLVLLKNKFIMAVNIDEKLINSAFNYEILYDLGHIITARKENVWEEIGRDVEISGKKTPI